MVARWLRWGPPGRLEWARACTGALCGIVLTGLVSRLVLGEAAAVLIAPIGATAVLLFALPASPLAQPWPIVGGNLLSALVGIACAKLIPDPVYAGGVAVAAALAVMQITRCLHPPGGAAALISVIGGPSVAAAGWSFAFAPVALNAVLLVLVGGLFNNASRHSYPHRASRPPDLHGTSDQPPPERTGYAAADLADVLAHYEELLDVSPDDLDALFRRVEARSTMRLHGSPTCGDIMSRDVIHAQAEEGGGAAHDRLLAHRLSAMPVLDTERRVLGVVGYPQLAAGAGRTVADVMRADPLLVRADAPVADILPLLSQGVQHEAIVVDAQGRLEGLITQTDLLAALARGPIEAPAGAEQTR